MGTRVLVALTFYKIKKSLSSPSSSNQSTRAAQKPDRRSNQNVRYPGLKCSYKKYSCENDAELHILISLLSNCHTPLSIPTILNDFT